MAFFYHSLQPEMASNLLWTSNPLVAMVCFRLTHTLILCLAAPLVKVFCPSSPYAGSFISQLECHYLNVALTIWDKILTSSSPLFIISPHCIVFQSKLQLSYSFVS